MAIAVNCQYCNEQAHSLHWCLREPGNWQRVDAWMKEQARDGVIIPRNQYISVAKTVGMPSATTLERQIAGPWSDVAAAFGLLPGKTRNATQKSRMDEARYTYNVDRDEMRDGGLAVRDTPRRDVWYSKRDGKVYEGLAWTLI